MANDTPKIEVVIPTNSEKVSYPCAILGKPVTVEFPGKIRFSISFLVPDQQVNSVYDALRVLRTAVSWTTASENKLREVLTTVKSWKFPVPSKQHILTQLTFRYGIQHFYKYCCIAGSASKLLYDGKYFDDLMDYLGDSGYSSGTNMWIPPDLICNTLIFIQEFDENIDEKRSASIANGIKTESGIQSHSNRLNFSEILQNSSGSSVMVDYNEAKNIIVGFIKELLNVESQINSSVLTFFTDNWLNNMYKGCFQFSSREAFCMYFNNVAVFEFSHHVMFQVPDIQKSFVRRLLVPQSLHDLEGKAGRNVPKIVAYEEGTTEDELTDMIGRLCGFELPSKSQNAHANLMNKINSPSSFAVRLCPEIGGSHTINGNHLRTISEILGMDSSAKSIDDDTLLFGKSQGRKINVRRNNGESSDDESDDDEPITKVECKATARTKRYKK
uniref:IVSP4-like protein n=1 Tax=Glypta fumiferanae TaxID=389681 RepID=A0A0F6Q8S8_9HYME|nr:IVSP4-like protein [Glypta fumiferanae]